MTISVASQTDTGLYRKWNQDALSVSTSPANDRALLIIADGMGGRGAGKAANYQDWESGLINRLKLAIEKANAALHNYNGQQKAEDKKFRGTNTTLTCALVQDYQAIIASVGDCRTYRFRGGQLYLVTKNRPLVSHGPTAQILYSFLGIERDVRLNRWSPTSEFVPDENFLRYVQLDVWTHALQAGDRLLLCSDGLYGEVEDEEIAEHLNEAPSPENAVQRLIEAANDKGGDDNISVVVCEMM